MPSSLLRGVVAAFSLLAALPAQKPVAEPRVGLQFVPPRGWSELPGDHDRHATLRLFVAPRAMASKAEGSHTPLLRVMFFKGGGDPALDVVDGLPRATPLRSLEDFARRAMLAKNIDKQPRKIGDVEGTRLIAKDAAGDHVLIGQSWTVDDGEVAVCVEALGNQIDKIQKEIDGALASIEITPRVAAKHTEVPWRADPDWAKHDAGTRRGLMRQWAHRIVDAAASKPEPGFKVSKSKHWTVLSAADPSFTKKAVAAAEAGREWLEKRLPELAKEPPLPAVLRVLDNKDHFIALLLLRNDLREFDQERRELYVVHDRDLGGSTGYGAVLRAVTWQMFADVDPAVLPGMPRWFEQGLTELTRSTLFDGKKFEFVSGDVERGRIEGYRQRDEELIGLWGIIQEKSQPSPTDGSQEPPWGYTPESARLLRWLLLFDGQKAFDRPTLVSDYVKAIAAAHDKVGPSWVLDVMTAALDKDQTERRNRLFYQWRDELLVAINNIAVPLSIEQWKVVNEKWVAFNKGFK